MWAHDWASCLCVTVCVRACVFSNATTLQNWCYSVVSMITGTHVCCLVSTVVDVQSLHANVSKIEQILGHILYVQIADFVYI